MRAIAVVMAAVLAGCGANEVADEAPRQLQGRVTLTSDKPGPTDRIVSEFTDDVTISDEHPYACRGGGGYDDQRAGAQVTVRNEAGDVIGIGRLSTGEYGALRVDTGEPISSLGMWRTSNGTKTDDGDWAYRGLCVFTFTVELTEDSDFYEVQVADRNPLTHTRAELEAAGWEVALTLGP